MSDCLEFVEKVPGYLCYRFQDAVSKTAAAQKMTHEYIINESSGV